MTQAAIPTPDRRLYTPLSTHATCGEWNHPIDVLSECSAIQSDWSESEWQHRRIVAEAKQQDLLNIVRARSIADLIVAA